jgi:hypothetical protein
VSEGAGRVFAAVLVGKGADVGAEVAPAVVFVLRDDKRFVHSKGADFESLAPLAGLVGKKGVDVAAKIGFEVVFRFLNFEPVSERESSRPRSFWSRW